jgi:hypothetical protein
MKNLIFSVFLLLFAISCSFEENQLQGTNQDPTSSNVVKFTTDGGPCVLVGTWNRRYGEESACPPPPTNCYRCEVEEPNRMISTLIALSKGETVATESSSALADLFEGEVRQMILSGAFRVEMDGLSHIILWSPEGAPISVNLE